MDVLSVCLGFVFGLLASVIIRVRFIPDEDTEKLINQRAVEIVRNALKQFDPICKFDDAAKKEEEDNGNSKEA